jgi:hypothetical protein
VLSQTISLTDKVCFVEVFLSTFVCSPATSQASEKEEKEEEN